MAEHLFYFFAGIAIIGACANIAALLSSTFAVTYYRDLLPKLLVAVARFGSAGAAVASRLAEKAKTGAPDWWTRMAIAAIASWFFWECFQALCDHKIKIATSLAQGTFDELKRQVRMRTRLLTCIRGSVHRKRQRLIEAVASQQQMDAKERLKAALNPKEQIYLTLEKLSYFIGGLRSSDQDGAPRQNFRIGLYISDNGALVPLIGYDTQNANYDPFASHKDHATRFRLDNQVDPAAAVECIQKRSLLIIEDCAKASDAGKFHYFSKAQRNYLRSVAAYPILDFRLPTADNVPASLIIDTDVAGYFHEDDRLELSDFLDEFICRLKLEWLMLGLLE